MSELAAKRLIIGLIRLILKANSLFEELIAEVQNKEFANFYISKSSHIGCFRVEQERIRTNFLLKLFFQLFSPKKSSTKRGPFYYAFYSLLALVANSSLHEDCTCTVWVIAFSGSLQTAAASASVFDFLIGIFCCCQCFH